MDSRIANFHQALDSHPVSRFQIWTLAVAFLLLLVDGYDAQSIAFVAPALGKDLHLARAALGPVFSSGLLGLMFGAVVFAPFADRFGTRPVLAICTLIYAVFTLATIWVASFEGLIALRLLTGFGLGGVMPNSVGVVLEYVPTRLRTTMVSIAVCGYPLGGAVGGVVSAAMVERFGWHSVFLVGAFVPLITLPLIVWSFPNSLLHVLNAPEPRIELHRIIAKVAPGWEPSKLAEVDTFAITPQFPIRLLFEGGYAGRTLLIWLAYFMNLVLLYFFVNWLPSVLNAGGLSLELASVATSLYNIGGIAGCFLIAYFCDRTTPQRTLCVTFVASAVSVLLIAWAGNAPVALIASTVVAGFCTIGGQIAMNAFTSAYYPPAARSSGLGWALAVGRFGSILGPLIAGFLIGMNVSGPNLFRLSSIPAALTALAIILVGRSPELPGGPTRDVPFKMESLREF